MRIGFAAPIHLPALSHWLDEDDLQGVRTYSFPYMSALVKGYLERGHEVDVFSYKLDSGPTQILGKGPLRVYLANRRHHPKLRAVDMFRSERRSLSQIIKAVKPDVVHAHWTYEFAAAALASGIPTLVTAHDSLKALRENYGGFYWNRRAALGKQVLRNVTLLSAVSPELLEEILADFPMLTGRSMVIPNGTALPKETQSRRNFGKEFVSIAHGFDERKNTRAVIEAFSSLRPDNPGVQLTMYGADHGTGEAAWRWAKKHGMTGSVRFAGAVSPEVLRRELTPATQCLVHASRWEACSMALLEAQAMGIPIIGGVRSGGVPYTLGYGSAGLLVDVTSTFEMAEAMQRVLDEPDLAGQLRESGLRLSQEKFSLNTVVDAYLRELSRCIDSR